MSLRGGLNQKETVLLPMMEGELFPIELKELFRYIEKTNEETELECKSTFVKKVA
ncbi:MAG: hypothetical protein HUJ53_10490, partial [Holdemanella sp.]|nr:hypothetical protein [Holdemanella sp.]